MVQGSAFAFRNLGDFLKRLGLWFTLIVEYPHVRKVFSSHKRRLEESGTPLPYTG